MGKGRVKRFLKKITEQQEPQEKQTSIEEIALKKQKVDDNLNRTIEILKTLYFVPNNNDITIRNIVIGGLNKKASIICINTISDPKIVEEHILQPLVTNQDITKDIQSLIIAPSISIVETIEDVLTNINNGNTALFVDGEPKAFMINTSNFEGRSIEKAENEVVVKGPKEAFTEKVTANISLMRKRIRSENLVVESATVSKRSKNEVYIVYMKDLANEQILNDIKKRIYSLDVDSIQNLEILEGYIEDRSKSLFPTILYTERPDRTASHIEDGYIALLMENSSASLVLPATFWSFFHNAEDYYLRLIFANFIRALRLFALFITLFISAIYIAVTNYHIEMLPADLLLAISATREIVPFPSVIEILMMELAFELIREAGLRVPSPIGPTIGIVGALILGQAAVQANIVSPLVVIIVALGGLSSFAIGDINMNFAIRLMRFMFIFSAAMFGFYGITALFIIGVFYLVSIKSFGVPYMAPLTPHYQSSKDTIFRRLIKNEKLRPGYLKPKDIEKR